MLVNNNSIYGRFFAFRQEKRDRFENFLTQAFADLLQRSTVAATQTLLFDTLLALSTLMKNPRSICATNLMF
jgi:hypothetical protein